MDNRLNIGSNDSSSSIQRSQDASFSSFTNSSPFSGAYKTQYSSYNNNNIFEANHNSHVFTPFPNNWSSGGNSGGPISPPGSQYQTQSQVFPRQQPQQQQSGGNYKNLDSLDLNFRNMSVNRQEPLSSGITEMSLNTVQPTGAGDDTEDSLNKLRFEIKQKDETICSLDLEVKRLQKLVRSLQDSKPETTGIPSSHYRLFERLSSNMLLLQNKFNESELYLESLITAIALSPQQFMTDTGRYDPEETAHKIISKLKFLQDENDEMLKMLSYGRSKQKDIELLLLRAQVVELSKDLSYHDKRT